MLQRSLILLTALIFAFAMPACKSVIGGGIDECDPDFDDDCTVVEQCDSDVDGDGICDDDEATWGGDVNVRDIFVEIDYMPDAERVYGITLTKKALQLIVDAFAAEGINMHFDIGNYFDANSVAPDPDNFNLGGGNEIDYVSHLSITGINCSDVDLFPGEDCSDYITAQEVKQMPGNFDPDRQFVYHYMVFGEFSDDDDDDGSGTVGIAEYPGNDFTLTPGSVFDPAGSQTSIDNQMAGPIMHELGHNLGLSHGGSIEDAFVNHKPNYESIMNYVYAEYGLNVTGTAEQFFEYSFQWNNAGFVVNNPGWPCYSNGVLTYDLDVDDIVLDYSHGLNNSINEANIVETAGYKPGSVQPIDFDCDSSIESSAYQEDLTLDADCDPSQPAFCDYGWVPLYETIEDYDDWGNLYLDIKNTSAGQSEKAGLKAPQFIRCEKGFKHGDDHSDHEHAYPALGGAD